MKKENNEKAKIINIKSISVLIGLAILTFLIVFTGKIKQDEEGLSAEEVYEFQNKLFNKLKEISKKEEEEENDETVIYKHRKKDLNLHELEHLIKEYLDENEIDFYDIGYTFYDIESEKEININQDGLFTAASTMKVPINIYAYDLAFKEGFDLDQIEYIYGNDLEGGTGIIQEEGAGGSYKISELLKLSITKSDNVATNVLYRVFGNRDGVYLLNSLANRYGIHSNYGNQLTAKDALEMLKYIYYNEEENPYFDYLIDDMKNTVYNDYYTRDFKNTTAHKVGDYDGYYNDIGIVFSKHPYIFSLYTNNLANPEDFMAGLGKLVDDWQEKQE